MDTPRLLCQKPAKAHDERVPFQRIDVRPFLVTNQQRFFYVQPRNMHFETVPFMYDSLHLHRTFPALTWSGELKLFTLAPLI